MHGIHELTFDRSEPSEERKIATAVSNVVLIACNLHTIQNHRKHHIHDHGLGHFIRDSGRHTNDFEFMVLQLE